MSASGMSFGSSMFSPQQIFSGLPGVAQGLFGNSGAAYGNAYSAYKPYYNEARQTQNPFFKNGVDAMGSYNTWANSMKDPSSFINNAMGNYKESPWASFQQQQALRAATNAGSASGLTGSTPMMQQVQQNASNISSQDMNQWLQNVLGINTQYGNALGNEMTMGQHAGDILSQLASGAGEYAGGAAYGERAGEENDRNALFSGIAKMFGG